MDRTPGQASDAYIADDILGGDADPPKQEAQELPSATGTAVNVAPTKSVSAFLVKLYNMVCDRVTDWLISWNSAGTSFLVYDHQEFSRKVLPLFFKHNNFASFVRQLNMYGFHKLPVVHQGISFSRFQTEIWEFVHPNFRKGKPELLKYVCRKKSRDQNESITIQPSMEQLFNEVEGIKRQQLLISSDIKNLKEDYKSLFAQSIELKSKYQSQQENIENIIKFIATLCSYKREQIGTNKRKRLIDQQEEGMLPHYKGNESIFAQPQGNLLSSAGDVNKGHLGNLPAIASSDYDKNENFVDLKEQQLQRDYNDLLRTLSSENNTLSWLKIIAENKLITHDKDQVVLKNYPNMLQSYPSSPLIIQNREDAVFQGNHWNEKFQEECQEQQQTQNFSKYYNGPRENPPLDQNLKRSQEAFPVQCETDLDQAYERCKEIEEHHTSSSHDIDRLDTIIGMDCLDDMDRGEDVNKFCRYVDFDLVNELPIQQHPDAWGYEPQPSEQPDKKACARNLKPSSPLGKKC